MKLLQQIWARIFYGPSILVHRLLCLVGIWRKWDWVDESILLGGAPTRREAKHLAANGIDATISVCEGYEMGRTAVIDAGMECLWIPVVDYACPGESEIREGAAFIRQQIAAGKKVFVFCKAGRVRSASIVLGYLLINNRITAAEALSMIRAARPQVNRKLDGVRAIVSVARSIQSPDRISPHHV